MLLVLSVVAVAVVAVLAVVMGLVLSGHLRPKGVSPAWLERTVSRQLTVHHAGGHTITGLLSEVTADGVVLRASKLLTPDGRSVPMAGETFVPRDKVMFTQLSD